MERSLTGVSESSTSTRKQGRRIPNTNLLEPKKFTRKELTEACRRQHTIHEKPVSSSLQKSKTPLESETDIESQVKVLDAGVKLCARKMNEYKSKGDVLEKEMKKKVDEYSSLKCETDALDEMIAGDNPETQKIENITKQMEETRNEAEAKLYYRNLLNYMLQRLRKNSIAFDAHLGAMLNTSNSAEKEREKCERMLGEIESGHTMAIHELNTFSLGVHADRSQRNRTLKSKRSEANNAKSIEAWRNEKESSRLKLEQVLGGAHKREIDKRNRILQDKITQLDELNQLLEANSGAYTKMEESFKHIKQATGVNTLTEMVDKFINHQEHHERLLIENKEAEEGLSEAKESLESSLEKFNEIKVVGFGETELNRDIINEISTKIEHERTEGRIVKSSNVRLEGALVELRQGVMVLYQRLISFHPSLIGNNAPTFGDGVADSAAQAAYDTREMITIAGKILVRMLDSIGGIENMRNLGNQSFAESDETIEAQSAPVNLDFNLGENNCRVKPKESPRLFDADDDESNTGQHNIDHILNEDAEVNERIVPSRSYLKAASEKQASDARRKAELEEKMKKLREKCPDDNDVMGTFESPSKAMKRRQEQASTRMAQHSSPVGLPKSVSVRDDPMTKAHAFLTELPDLE